MPYINQDTRKEFDNDISSIADKLMKIDKSKRDGTLNYLFTKLLLKCFGDEKVGYLEYERLIGILECCKLELYRKAVSEYEDKKIFENGDVY